jgi:putative Flp pilus-assembly TadE/G-like protein
VGERHTVACRERAPAESGQVALLFALLVPMILAIGAIVVGVGNWYTHAKNLQSKVDAAAFAGGAVWGFPCGADIDANIEAQARLYFGSHTAPLAGYTSPYNPQVGKIGGDRLYVSLNQAQWWGGTFPGSDFSSPAGSVCASKVLDVKATERDVSPLWKLIPLFPDIKKKARVQIEEISGLTGLLPIAVRLPQPLSAAAVFYNEGSAGKEILAIAPFRQMCIDAEPDCTFGGRGGAPPGLGQWTTDPKVLPPPAPPPTWPSVAVKPKTGVVIATSVRPACGAGTPPAGPPCLSTDPTLVGTSIDTFCRNSGTAVSCFDADGGGATQTVRSGVHFIQGYTPTGVTNGRPEVGRAWLENAGDCPGTGYFNSHSTSCHVTLTVEVDIGSLEEDVPPTPPDELVQTRVADHVQARYCQVRRGETATDICVSQFNDATGHDMSCTGGPGIVKCTTTVASNPLIALDSRENSFAIRVRLRRTSVPGFLTCSNDPASDYSANCNFFFTGAGYIGDSVPPTAVQVLTNPIQRSFMGHLERTGPLKWLRLTVDPDCGDPLTPGMIVGHVPPPSEADAASQVAGSNPCYAVDMGLAGGLARDQDEPPIAFNLGDNSSQRAYVDCDYNLPNLKDEIVAGCGWPPYAANKFDTNPYCPSNSGFFTVPKAAPFDTYPPFKCVLTQTGNSSQVIQGFNERIFNKSNNPTCPADLAFTDPTFTWGRNYWHRMNNIYDEQTFAWDGTGPPFPNGTAKGNTLNSRDPRLVSLFFTTYDSFSDTGNEVFPIVGFGNFYVTGYGETINGGWKGGAPEDPCADGNDGNLLNGTGNEPPPDLDMSRNTRWVWGHFVKDVTPAPFTTGGSGVLCNPEASFQPCVAVLVE